MDDLIAQFAIEGRELVQQAAQDLASLEAAPDRRDALESAFRAIHTLKGSVGLFDFGPMLGVLHEAEDALSRARAGEVAIDAALIDPLLAVIDWVDDCIDGISVTGQLSEVQSRQAPRLLNLLRADASLSDTGAASSSSVAIPEWAATLSARASLPDQNLASVAIRYEPHPECFFNGDDPLAVASRLPGLVLLSVSLKDHARDITDYDPFRCNLVIEAVSAGHVHDVESVFRLIPDQVIVVRLPARKTGGGEQVTVTKPASGVIRVSASRIDSLIEIAGELVTAKNSLVDLVSDAREQGNNALARRIAASHLEIERLVGSLYGSITQARMIPLEHTFRRFPRLVRENSRRLGKTVDLVIEGETIEADREIVESLFEPLLHLVRNSLDHGLEADTDRMKTEKPARGRILVRARQRGDQIEIEVADDGRGIDALQVKQTAVKRRLIDEIEAADMAEKAALQLVFSPGFSTTSNITDLSGRGVGLDAVRRAIQRLSGTIEIRSEVGAGTSFVLALPISFSMSQLMIVRVGGERYGIPISDIRETLKLQPDAIQAVKSGRAFILRDRTVPLLNLAELLGVSVPASHSIDRRVLIVRSGDAQVGLAVDAIFERAETLTRPLTGLLQGLPGIAGTTILGNGQILLVLDIEGLVR